MSISNVLRSRRSVHALVAGLFAAALLVVALAVAATSLTDEADKRGGSVLRSCEVSGESALCGSIRVPEDRSAGAVTESRAIPVRIVVLPASGPRREADPVLFLQGGPGGAATAMAGVLSRSSLRRSRDIVLVDQRGTGGSNGLHCPSGDLDDILDLEASFEYEQASSCLASLDVDPRHYATASFIEDLEDVRRALGIERWNLFGGSYGTRVALEYIRREPARVRTATLRGVAPPSYTLPVSFDRDSMAALQLVLDDCKADRRCDRAFPSIDEQLPTVLERLASRSPTATIRAGGERAEVRVTRERFVAALHHALYSSEWASRIPSWIDAAGRGRFDDLMSTSARFAVAVDATLAVGATLSVACAEDVPFYDPRQVVREARDTLLRGALSHGLARACEAWPTDPVPKSFKEPVRSDVPVLLISGEADPVTAPRHAEQALRHLANGRHIVMPQMGHVELTPGCVERLVARFVEQASADELDARCVSSLRRPEFRTP